MRSVEREVLPRSPRPHWWERKGPCIGTPAATLQTLPGTALTLRKRCFRAVMMAGGVMTWERSRGQYSSASMTVITRTVTAGSVGSGEW
jgi:hypothetical protein